MAICGQCGREVKALTTHATKEHTLCLRCLSKSGFFSVKEEEEVSKYSSKGSLRIPCKIRLGQSSNEGNIYGRNYFTLCVDINISGICFVWDSCVACRGFSDEGIHEKCIFYPFHIENEGRRELQIELEISDSDTIKTDAYATYTAKEEKYGLEYVGVQFINLSLKDRQIIEKMNAC